MAFLNYSKNVITGSLRNLILDANMHSSVSTEVAADL